MQPSPLPPKQKHMSHIPWIEYKDINGHFYYYNSVTQESTWNRPGVFLALGMPDHPLNTCSLPAKFSSTQPIPHTVPSTNNASLRAISFKQVPGTVWKVVLTFGNKEFYYNSKEKSSTWLIPKELKDLVAELKNIGSGSNPPNIADEEGLSPEETDSEGSISDQSNDSEEEGESEPENPKKRKISERAFESAGQVPEESTELGEEDIAFQLLQNRLIDAKSIHQPNGPEEEARKKTLKVNTADNNLNQTKSEENSLERNMEIFKELLQEKNISPFSAWEIAVPKIIHDSRYSVLRNIKEKRQAFESYCVEHAKTAKKEIKLQKDTLEGFKTLLNQEVKSNTSWDFFRKKWRHDKRFLDCNVSEREVAFKEHIASLKQQKVRPEKDQKEVATFEKLLQESNLHKNSSWRDSKRILSQDDRFFSIESSSKREEIFRSFITSLGSEEEEEKKRNRRMREEESLRQREREVRREQKLHQRDIRNKRQELQREEGCVVYQTMLIDLIRNHHIGWETGKKILEIDPRWESCNIPLEEKKSLFFKHNEDLYKKRLNAFYSLIEREIPKLDEPWTTASVNLSEHPEISKLSTDNQLLEKLYVEFMSKRLEKAKEYFGQLLQEHALLKYKLQQGKITIEEVKDILQTDQRYLVFDASPGLVQEREEILKSFILEIERKANLTRKEEAITQQNH